MSDHVTMSATNSKPSTTCILVMSETVKLFHKIIIQHYIDDEKREKKETDEWQQQKQERAEKRERWAQKLAEREKAKKEREETKKEAPPPDNETEEEAEKRKKKEEDEKKKQEEEDEQDEDNIPDEKEFDKHREFILKRRPPPRSDHTMRKQLFRYVKNMISFSINSEPSKTMAASAVLDELLSVSFEYLAIFRDVGMAVVVCSYACNLSAHLSVRNLIDATALVQWFLEVALLFNALKRVVHLCLLGISNAAMCKDLRINDEMSKNFASCVCRLHGETRVVEAWSCAIINLVGASKVFNGPMLLKHDVFSMLERMVTIHGTDDQTAARGIQALTCLSLVHFPAKPAANTTAISAPNTANASAANSLAGSPHAKNPSNNNNNRSPASSASNFAARSSSPTMASAKS